MVTMPFCSRRCSDCGGSGPTALASVVSDGQSCPPLGRLGAWVGTCEEFGSGLDPDDVRHGLPGRSGAGARVGEVARIRLAHAARI